MTRLMCRCLRRLAACVLLAALGVSVSNASEPEAPKVACARVGDLLVVEPAKSDTGATAKAGDLSNPHCSGTKGTTQIAFGEVVSLFLDTKPDCTASYVILFDGVSSGIVNNGCSAEQSSLTFSIWHAAFKDSDSTEARLAGALWERLLRNFWEARDFSRGALLSLRPVGAPASMPASNETPIAFKIVQVSLWRVMVLLLVLAAIGALIWTKGSGMLRDRGAVAGGSDASFSLSRFQMAWWFAVIFLATAFVWIIVGELPTFGKSVLTLLGLTVGTGLVSTSIDKANNTPVSPSAGWFKDLTTDFQGVTLYRFQFLIWTLFFGIVFLAQVASTLALPELDSTAFLLMGASSATYLGFKVPEKQAAPDTGTEDAKGAYGTS